MRAGVDSSRDPRRVPTLLKVHVMDRRDTLRRAELVRSIVAGVVRNPYAVVTRESLQNWLQIPCTVADRIIGRLVSSGILTEIRHGVWARVPQG
jgi:hypothetical protein